MLTMAEVSIGLWVSFMTNIHKILLVVDPCVYWGSWFVYFEFIYLFIYFSTGLWLEAFSPPRNHLAIGRCWFWNRFDYSSPLCFNFTFGLSRLNLMPPDQVWNLQQRCTCRCLLQPAKPLSSNSHHFSKPLAFFL